jgi:hypothetical protein
MGTKSKSAKGGAEVLNFFRGGKPMPESFLRKRMAHAKSTMAARFKEKYAIDKQYVKFWNQIHKPPNPGNSDPQTAQGLDGILSIHKKLAKQKLLPPGILGELGGIISGQFGATIAPPFDYAYSLAFQDSGNPTLTGSADKTTGQSSGSAITNSTAPSAGSIYTEIGIYLHPMFGPAILTVSAHPAFSIEWWTNSLNINSPVRSFGEGSLGIYAQTGEIGPSTGVIADFDSWDEQATNQVLFDFGSNPHIPVSAQLPVDPSLECAIFVATTTHVEGVGWPGSLAGSMMTVTLPSITFQLDRLQVLEP